MPFEEDVSRRDRFVKSLPVNIPRLLVLATFVLPLIVALLSRQPLLAPATGATVARLIWFSLFLIVWGFLISSQALLPVSNWKEILQTWDHLVLFFLGAHGPAIFIKDGKLKATAEELRRPVEGVAVIDFNSGMVLEQVAYSPGCLSAGVAALSSLTALLGLSEPPAKTKKKDTPDKPIRICGPGLVFLASDERIQGVGDLAILEGPVEELTGVVDLRRQSRSSTALRPGSPGENKTSVRAYTRDGIELGTNVSASFTIGQNVNWSPNVLHVTYDCEHGCGYKPEDLRVVTLEEKDGAIKIKSLSDELDSDDCEQIHKSFRHVEWQRYCALPRNPREPIFDETRVFSAVYARARWETGKSVVMPWTELPVRVAVDFFREELSHLNFDQLYVRDCHSQLGIERLRARLRTRMRNNGMLSYRMLMHGRELPLTPDEAYPARDLKVSPVEALCAPKELRDRGVQVMAAGFSDLIPEREVYLQWLAKWRADWERDTMQVEASGFLDTARLYTLVKAEAEQEVAADLRHVMVDGGSQDIIAVRILQTLESLATERETRRLLPPDTIDMLNKVHRVIMPGNGSGPRAGQQTMGEAR